MKSGYKNRYQNREEKLVTEDKEWSNIFCQFFGCDDEKIVFLGLIKSRKELLDVSVSMFVETNLSFG